MSRYDELLAKIRSRHCVFSWLCTVVASILFAPDLLAAPAPASAAATGQIRLKSGAKAAWEYHFDRNALSDSRLVGSALIALTESGNLLRFVARPLKLTHERFGPVSATSLGGNSTEVFVGYEDGRIEKLDPATLAGIPLAQLHASVRWIGATEGAGRGGSQLVAIVATTAAVEKDGKLWDVESAEVHDLASGRIHRLEKVPSAVLLDRQRRLWLGGDRGEWGGWCARLDLTSGRLAALDGASRRPSNDVYPWDGVYGFVELADGQVWAHGGISHMGHRGFIARIDGPRPERLASFGGTKDPSERDDGSLRPRAPISHIVQDRRSGELTVLSYSDVYRTDLTLQHWRRLHQLKIHYPPGRPDAMGSYPAVRSIHSLNGSADNLLLATRMDGYVELAGSTERGLGLSNQLPLPWIERIENTEAGLLFLAGRRGDNPATIRDGQWTQVSLAPPFEQHSDEPRSIPPHRDWFETKMLVDPTGAVFTVSSSNGTPGTRTTAKWNAGTSTVLERANSDLWAGAALITPDRRLWTVGLGEVRRFSGSRWEVVGKYLYRSSAPGGIDVGLDLRAVDTPGPPWLLHDRRQRQLLWLTPENGGSSARLSRSPVTEGAQPLHIDSVVPLTKRILLLATDRGLRELEPATGRIQASTLVATPQTPMELGRDRQGRLWLAGHGLSVATEGDRQFQTLDALPLPRSGVCAIASDPRQADGVVVSFRGRGVAFVQIGRR